MNDQELLQEALRLEGPAQQALLAGDEATASERFAAAADAYRRSWEAAGPGAFGRLVGMLKAHVLAGAGEDAAADYAREQVPDPSSPTSWYVCGIAAAIQGERGVMRNAADGMQAGSDAFARAAAAMRALADRDDAAFTSAVQAIADDFAGRAEHLTGVAIADTALMFERLRDRRPRLDPAQRLGIRLAAEELLEHPRRRPARSGAARANSVIDERSFMASMTPRTAPGPGPVEARQRLAHSTSRGPSTGCSGYARASSSERDRVALRHGAAAEPRDLREDEPHPVAGLAAGAQLREGARRRCRLLILRGDEALEVRHAVEAGVRGLGTQTRRSSMNVSWATASGRRTISVTTGVLTMAPSTVVVGAPVETARSHGAHRRRSLDLDWFDRAGHPTGHSSASVPSS